MGWKSVLSFMFILSASVLLFVYWFVPYESYNFQGYNANTNFSINSSNGNSQFYENMRFPDKKISYRTFRCSIKKQEDMERAFNTLSSKTSLEFYPVSSGEEIFVTCDEKNKIEDGLFIAGEGGPTNITSTDLFNVIYRGEILLIRDSNCETPNIAIHELIHVLGFNHSSNPGNIMYPISKCGQKIGDDTIVLINELYSYPSLPDLSFGNVSAVMNGRYLNTNITVKNNGLKDSEKFSIEIFADGKKLSLSEGLESESLGVGYGRIVSLRNVLINQIKVKELEYVINYPSSEIEKNNNRIKLSLQE